MPKKTSKPRSKKTPDAAPFRREVGALVAFLLAVFTFLGYFGVSALFVDFLNGFLRRVFGYGFFVIPLLLLLLTVILLFHRGRPVKRRVWCALFSMLIISILLHIWLYDMEWVWSFDEIGGLWTSGNDFESGGIVAGLLAEALCFVFSGIGASIALLLTLVIMLLSTFNLSIVAVYDYLFRRERPEYEYEETPRKTPRPKPEKRSSERDPVPTGPRKKPFFMYNAGADEPEKEPGTQETPEPPIVAPPKPLKRETDFPIRDNAPVAVPVQRETAAASSAATASAAPAAAGKGEPAPSKAGMPYELPDVELLNKKRIVNTTDSSEEMRTVAANLMEVISSFAISARITNVIRGPSLTRYELELERGTPLAKLQGRADDIALSLGVSDVSIAPVPDKMSIVGIEVPNKTATPVFMRDVVESPEFSAASSVLSFCIGKDISGRNIVGDIGKLPHLLIAGTTGSGKSVCMNSLIVSLLYKAKPDEVKLIMIDPKMVELAGYEKIPHLLIPVVIDAKRASGALQWAVVEMEKRYRMFMERGVREFDAYNESLLPDEGLPPLPRIVIVIDELADLMMVAAKEIEESICRIAQKARAAGMHLIIATQRPTAKVITGLMKSNIPSRIAFAVSSGLDSRIILDTNGAEKLIGKGDMLYLPIGASKALRVQGCYITNSEVKSVVDHVKQFGSASYSEEVLEQIDKQAENTGKHGPDMEPADAADEFFEAAVEIVMETGQASASFLQRRLKVGNARASRIMDQMEERGYVGPTEGAKPRQILITREQWENLKAKMAND